METCESFFDFFGTYVRPLFDFLKFWTLDILIIGNAKILKSWKVRDEDWKEIIFAVKQSPKAWMWISYRSQNMKWIFGFLGDLKIWRFEIWKFEDLKIRNLKIWNFEIWRFEILKIWFFDNYFMIIWWNHEKSKTRNVLGLIFH